MLVGVSTAIISIAVVGSIAFIVSIDLRVGNQKPPSNESGLCFPGEKIWSGLLWSIEQRTDTGKTQFIGSHLESLFVHLLAIDLDLCFLDLCLAKCIEVFRHLFGGTFNAICIVAVKTGIGLIFSSAATTTAANRVDGVEIYKHRAVLDLDVNFSSVRQLQHSSRCSPAW